MTLLTSEMRKARKVHQCIWCGEMVHAGEQYRYYSIVFEGELQSNHMHPECFAACNEELLDSRENEFTPYEHERPDTEGGEG